MTTEKATINKDEVLNKIKEQIANNKIILYMKGSPQFPNCGFSARAVNCLNECNANFMYVDILQEPEIRQILPEYAGWPTFPQLYINGELIGGSDIILELHQENKLKELLQEKT